MEGMEFIVLVDQKKREGRKKDFFYKTKKKRRGKKNILCRIDSLTAHYNNDKHQEKVINDNAVKMINYHEF